MATLGFWGLIVEPKKPQKFVVTSSFKITMACFGEKVKGNKRSCLKVELADKSYALCSLIPNKLEQQRMAVVFSDSEEVTFSVSGENPVYLTGNYLPLDFELPYDDEDDYEGESLGEEDTEEEEEEESDEEEPRGIKRKAREAKDLANGFIEDDEDEEDDEDYVMKEGEDESEEEDEEDEEFSDEDDQEVEENEKESDQEEVEKSIEKKEGKIGAKEQESQKKKSKEKKKEEAESKDQEKKAVDAKKEATSKVESSNNANESGKESEEATEESKTKNEKKPKEQPVKQRKLANGLIIEEKSRGNGARAKFGKKVGIRYIGRIHGGKVFDKNVSGPPLYFTLGKGEVIKGFDLGIDGMLLGEQRKLVIPAALAYGAKGNAKAGVPKNATLEFDVKLVSIK
ncbi:uncharacterized protein VTP21DRAFT_799 [Calcarisporiella thermophila]|uniref:uncharacterized protein n=1 Tax=Calcarisporiella thermophila TaxID=911321 RepID=UPI00374275F9